MIGGAGNDRFVVDRAGDRIVETAGGGIDLLVTAAISIDVANYRNVENVDITGDRDLRITGSSAGNKLDGNAGENLLQGLAGNDLLTGRIGNDRLFGGRGADTLRGGDGADKLIGGRGKDVMTGGAGADDFVFLADNDSTTGTQADRITDFRSRIDDLDFREIAAGGQFIGNAAFTGQAGQVRYSTSGGRVQADLDGDGAADFVIVLENLPTLRAIDFLF
jgi:Ca2+-binding RTX toxin-like protein